MERESEELRRKLRASQPGNPHPSPIALLTAAAEMGIPAGPQRDSLSNHSRVVSPESYPPQLLAPSSLGSGTPGPALENNNDATLPRTLNGVEVTGGEIDELFEL